ncbi:hypothetical protein [Novosphingobium album (ex Liu et al. 2023)]|uniref:Terminase small subunit n=1 Tax=Novosphingobium album (ex Liu et al. 2023) TaxID=3031130 RepID=A0ABT5WMI1_9SPHN|nr:hypothetical protein [Novosphingobium album (ex Liu et al. 2023)]MDE8651241.1 hypothetical protein [Novosphingobium album (ex Liu et al. 2023)]
MIDKKPRKRKRGTLPAFTPVPRRCQRHDGWTPDRQRRFIEALADLGSVDAAARAVNMSPEGAYLLRRHPEAGEFRKAWEAALALGVQRLEDIAMDRALNGVDVPIYHFGAVVGTRRVYNDRLLMFMLRNRAPKRFAADSLANLNAVERGNLERLKAQWRKEWEAERAAEDKVRAEQALETLDAKLDLIVQRRREAEQRQIGWDGEGGEE